MDQPISFITTDECAPVKYHNGRFFISDYKIQRNQIPEYNDAEFTGAFSEFTKDDAILLTAYVLNRVQRGETVERTSNIIRPQVWPVYAVSLFDQVSLIIPFSQALIPDEVRKSNKVSTFPVIKADKESVFKQDLRVGPNETNNAYRLILTALDVLNMFYSIRSGAEAMISIHAPLKGSVENHNRTIGQAFVYTDLNFAYIK
jgi:hypothetical protein